MMAVVVQHTQVLKKSTYLGRAAKVDLIHARTDSSSGHHSEEMDDSCVMNN